MSTGYLAAGDNEVRPEGSVLQRLANAELQLSTLHGSITTAYVGWTSVLCQVEKDLECRMVEKKSTLNLVSRKVQNQCVGKGLKPMALGLKTAFRARPSLD